MSQTAQASVQFNDIRMIDHIAKLFPLPRSITGRGTEATLDYFESYFPELERIQFATGDQVFDWEVPMVWNVNEAYAQHIRTGVKYFNIEDNNLNLVGYSKPVDDIIDFSVLNSKLHSLPRYPYWTPYVTSYYKKEWGFCTAEILRNQLPNGDYKVKINSEFRKGFLNLTHAIIRGRQPQEIFFSSYVCHPSMANNELSGPVVMAKLLDYIQSQYPNPSFSYRFVFLPETIGSIAYLSKYGQDLKKHCIAGFNLSCVGDNNNFSVIHSPYRNTLADAALESSLLTRPNVIHYSYLSNGSDERQYCSPSFRLPLCTFCRTKFGDYAEYHTSADNLLFVTDSGLNEAFNRIRVIVDAFELGHVPVANVACEPQMSKRGLYATLGIHNADRDFSLSLLNHLSYCDGSNTIFGISKLLDCSLDHTLQCIKTLADADLVMFADGLKS